MLGLHFSGSVFIVITGAVQRKPVLTLSFHMGAESSSGDPSIQVLVWITFMQAYLVSLKPIKQGQMWFKGYRVREPGL